MLEKRQRTDEQGTLRICVASFRDQIEILQISVSYKGPSIDYVSLKKDRVDGFRKLQVLLMFSTNTFIMT